MYSSPWGRYPQDDPHKRPIMSDRKRPREAGNLNFPNSIERDMDGGDYQRNRPVWHPGNTPISRSHSAEFRREYPERNPTYERESPGYRANGGDIHMGQSRQFDGPPLNIARNPLMRSFSDSGRLDRSMRDMRDCRDVIREGYRESFREDIRSSGDCDRPPDWRPSVQQSPFVRDMNRGGGWDREREQQHAPPRLGYPSPGGPPTQHSGPPYHAFERDRYFNERDRYAHEHPRSMPLSHPSRPTHEYPSSAQRLSLSSNRFDDDKIRRASASPLPAVVAPVALASSLGQQDHRLTRAGAGAGVGVAGPVPGRLLGSDVARFGFEYEYRKRSLGAGPKRPARTAKVVAPFGRAPRGGFHGWERLGLGVGAGAAFAKKGEDAGPGRLGGSMRQLSGGFSRGQHGGLSRFSQRNNDAAYPGQYATESRIGANHDIEEGEEAAIDISGQISETCSQPDDKHINNESDDVDNGQAEPPPNRVISDEIVVELEDQTQLYLQYYMLMQMVRLGINGSSYIKPRQPSNGVAAAVSDDTMLVPDKAINEGLSLKLPVESGLVSSHTSNTPKSGRPSVGSATPNATTPRIAISGTATPGIAVHGTAIATPSRHPTLAISPRPH